MSWFSTNYEKALLGGAAVIAIGFVYAGWSKLGSIDESFQNPSRGPGRDNNPAVIGAEEIPKALQSMALDREVTRGVAPGDRPVDLFTGIALFLKREGTDKPIDLLKGSDVHSGIPNEWWIDNNVDPGYADSPERDEDGDGFSNREEFIGKTDPNSKAEHPPLIDKLRYVKEESMDWYLRPSFGGGGAFPFEYFDGKGGKNRAGAGNPVKPDQTFFDEEPAKGRFKLLGQVERKEMNDATNIEMTVTYVRVQDLKPNKAGKIYEIPAPLNRREINQHIKHDRSAVLTLEALGFSGEEWLIEENTRFSLPQGEDQKDYLLKEVTPEEIVIEYPAEDGSKQEKRIPKSN